jgi:hypothetical protein
MSRNSNAANASVIVEHLPNLQFSPAIDPKAGWIDSIAEHRRRLEFDLTPRLVQILQDELPRLYRLARRNAKRTLPRHGEDAAADALPEDCPYTLEQITGDWWP